VTPVSPFAALVNLRRTQPADRARELARLKERRRRESIKDAHAEYRTECGLLKVDR
jgi:hypothetical protein